MVSDSTIFLSMPAAMVKLISFAVALWIYCASESQIDIGQRKYLFRCAVFQKFHVPSITSIPPKFVIFNRPVVFFLAINFQLIALLALAVDTVLKRIVQCSRT